MEKSKFSFEWPFFKRVLTIGGPIMLQNILLSAAGFFDTIMVGSIYRGVSAVGVAQQYVSIMTTVMFGVNAGMSLYLAQFYGAEDRKGMAKSFALMLWLNLGLTLFFTITGFFFADAIIGFYNTDPEIIRLGGEYLRWVSLGFAFQSLAFAFSLAYRAVQKTQIPLLTAIISQFVNVAFNYILIFGMGPIPALGVAGAAIATVISQIVSSIIYVWHAKSTHQGFYPHAKDFADSLHPHFFAPTFEKTLVLTINELFFGVGMTLYVKIMNDIGTNAYEGFRIAETIANLFMVAAIGLGSASGALIGQQLGKNDLVTARRQGNTLLITGVILGVAVGILSIAVGIPGIQLFQNTNADVNLIAVSMIFVFGFRIFLRLMTVVLFNTLRAGGQVKIVMFLDAGMMWLVGLPLGWIAFHWWGIRDATLVYLIVQAEGVIRIIFGLFFFTKGYWLVNLTGLKRLKES